MVWNSDEEEGETKINDRYRSQTQTGLQGIICAPSLMSICCVFNVVYTISNEYMLQNPSLMSIYSVFHLSRENAVYSIS